MHAKNVINAGKQIQPATPVLIMIHGRGASAEDILSLSQHLDIGDFSLIAPQATNHTWYPYSFMSPAAANEPWLSSALDNLSTIVEDLQNKGIKKQEIYFLGFSQGACLTLEFATRNASEYGGLIAFTGGLIGEELNLKNYTGDFKSTPVFIGTSDPDPHVPVSRVHETVKVLEDMNAKVTLKIFKGMGHTISAEEIDIVNKMFFN